jgi:hypothetical protein
MYKRINITLPESTVRLMERVAGKGDRSRLVDEALKQYLRGAARGVSKKGSRKDPFADLSATEHLRKNGS